MFNHRFWGSYFRRQFVPQLRAVLEVLEGRTLPAFAGIEEEAERVSEEAWDTFMSGPGTGDEDPSEFAEAAKDMSVSHYLLLSGLRQGMINLFAAALYHTFEQQLILFLRREIPDPREENKSALYSLSELQARLGAQGLIVADFPSWRKLKELRLVANTVKHAEGKSARELQAVRPDLFRQPEIADMGIGSCAARVFQPLVGEDLYVSLDDVRLYCDAAVSFWTELPDAMGRIG